MTTDKNGYVVIREGTVKKNINPPPTGPRPKPPRSQKAPKRPSLFQRKDFVSHAGLALDFKIECDALTDEDVETLAYLISRRVRFRKVYGIPRGGLRFEEALRQYEDATESNILIVDDVFTTGKSVTDFREELVKTYGYRISDIKAAVIFARGNIFNFMISLFNMVS